MTPDTLLRTAALNAIAAAAAAAGGDQDFAPLVGAQIFVGQTWPSQSPAPGAAPMPNQLLLYGWDQESESVSGNTTVPKFHTTLTLVVEARVETRSPAATATLPAQPSTAQIDAAVDGALSALCFAVKKAICQGIQVAALSLNGGKPVIEEIKAVKIANKYAETGQRIAGNGAVGVDLIFGEYFEPLIPNALSEIAILTGAEAGGAANTGNHGNGTISAVAVGLGATPGAYPVAFTSATAFSVTMPDGTAAGGGTVGTAFSGGGLTFTITAGTTPFAAGDGFTVTVEAATETILNPSS